MAKTTYSLGILEFGAKTGLRDMHTGDLGELLELVAVLGQTGKPYKAELAKNGDVMLTFIRKGAESGFEERVTYSPQNA